MKKYIIPTLILLFCLAVPVLGSTIQRLPMMTLSGTTVVPRDSSWSIGTSTTIYYGDSTNLTGSPTFTNLTVSGTLTLTGTVGSAIDMANNLITNIGAAGTDFTSGGGLNLAGGLTIEPDTDTLTALTVNDTDSNNVLTVDTINNKVVADSFERICPGGYVWVPGSAKFGTLPGFCVMKYEARNSGGLPSAVDPTAVPWVSISQETARAECISLGEGYHLISEPEWMTIAENIAVTAINDTDADAGIQLATGHSDNAPASALTTTVASDPVVSGCNLSATMEHTDNAYSAGSCEIRGDGTDSKGYYGTGQGWATTGYVSGAANKAQLRTHILSNGEVLWDISGNVYNWTDKISICDEHPYELSASTTSQWMEYTDAINYKGLSYLRPADDGWSATNGIGRIYTDIGNTASSVRAFLRGGVWYSTSYVGVFSLALSNLPTSADTGVGFRCAQ